ncbi:MOSC N-terminal beta barrel domain-containing protein [Micromonospora echinofusca]|uniref:MOSC domain-containing protein n=1 Tax=Micromonospora echinofusca TaxID=47858 RepID=UPI000C70B992|nr:MOSC N-terminal beta barrel domain-containing protein [Micromonospora sp. MSM11]MCL7459559.1 MOSC domain-containing protein [Micromonospora sp. MSM11]
MTGRLAQLWRYPVKSMLGERLPAADVGPAGVAGDRRLALRHRGTGRVASAKHPRLWRGLLALHATGAAPGPVRITLPDGRAVSSVDPDVDDVLSRVLDAPVTLIDRPPAGAVLDRADPDAVLAAGLTAEVPVDASPLGAAAPGTFFDFAPVHLVTTATLARVAAELPAGTVEAVRYRPNLVLDVDVDGFAENDWVGRELRIGPELVLRVLAPTPRCAVPTLAHGPLPRQGAALRVPARLNRVAPLPQLGPQPCVGAYAQVVRSGRVAQGSTVEVG